MPLFGDIVATISDPFVIDSTSLRVHSAATALMSALLKSMVGRGKAAIEGHFLATGRLTSLRGSVATAFQWLLQGLCDATATTTTSLIVSDSATATATATATAGESGPLSQQLALCLVLLSQLDRDSSDDSNTATGGAVTLHCLRSMMLLHGKSHS